MEIHSIEYQHHHRTGCNNNNNSSSNSNYCRSASLAMHHQYRGETVVATPMASYSNWGQPLCASNITSVNAGSNKKRDFHFQVISVNEGPKWFVWPSQKSTDQPESTNPSKNSSNQENENHYHKNGAISPNTVQPNAPMTINVAHLQRKNRLSRRKQLADMHHYQHCSIVDGEYAHVTATNSTNDAPLSEPLARRMLSKPIICVTPSGAQDSSPSCSSSMPSQTFKILSVSKKSWESEDEEEGVCSCRKMSLSLDDDCELPSRAHCALSGSSVSSYISTASSSSSSSTSSNQTSDDSGVCNGGNNNNYD